MGQERISWIFFMNRSRPPVPAADVFVLAAILAVFAFPAPAHAYLDPGLGSAIVASVLGFLAAMGYWLRSFIARVKERFGKKPGGPADR